MTVLLPLKGLARLGVYGWFAFSSKDWWCTNQLDVDSQTKRKISEGQGIWAPYVRMTYRVSVWSVLVALET